MIVRNFSDKILNPTQLHLLNQGLNHSIFLNKLNLSDVQAEFELLYQQSRGYLTVEQRLKLKQTFLQNIPQSFFMNVRPTFMPFPSLS